jgi:hydroxymethylbilane synthase
MDQIDQTDDYSEVMIKGKLRIGTRGSALALAQTHWVAERLMGKHPRITIEIVPIKTTGDRMQSVSLSVIGGKGVFVKEIEEALLKGEVDLAIHSMKDLPSEIPADLVIGAVPEREDPRDVFISGDGRRLEQLTPGARIGTGSLRRGLQLRRLVPDVEVVSIRGNLDTRIRKIEREKLDGIIVAAAGLRRMGWESRVTQFIPVDSMIPAVGQGALAVEWRRADAVAGEIVSFLNDPVTEQAVMAERAFLGVLGGGCQVPVAAHATIEGDVLHMRAFIGTTDGSVFLTDKTRGPVAENTRLGKSLAEAILSRGGREILDAVYACRQ